MSIVYELWNTTSNNRYGEYDTREEALAAVHRTVLADGRIYAERLSLNSEDEAGEIEEIAEGTELIRLAAQDMVSQAQSQTQTSNPPVATTITVRQSSAFRDARNIGINASAIAASLSNAAAMSQLAHESLLRIASISIPPIPTINVASMYPPNMLSTTFAALGSINWERYLAAQSIGLRQMVEAANTNALADSMLVMAEMAEQSRMRLNAIATQIARQASVPAQVGAYLLPIRSEPGISFVYEHTESEDYIAAVASIDENPRDERRDVVVRLVWRREDDIIVSLFG